MNKTITKIFALVALCGTTSLFAQLTPEVLYYKFDSSGTTVPNLASAPPPGTATANILGGLTQGGSSICQGTMIGSGISSTTDYVNTGWAPNLGTGSWTISFRTENITPSATLFYIFGDVGTNSFRCFTNGVAGANNWILRGAGLTDIYINGGATVAPHMNTFVYDASLNQVRAYLDGVLVSTVAQGAPNLTGAGPLKVVGYSANVGMPANGHLDEYRVYSRALTPAEITQLNNPFVPSGFLGADQSLCPGDSIQLQFNLPYTTALWSTGSTTSSASVTAAGTVTLAVSGACGTGNDTVLINLGIAPVVTLGADVAQCGGTVLLDAGAGAYSYLWNDATTNQTLTATASGMYYVRVTDTLSGCFAFDTINIAINSNPLPNLGADQTQCGGTITLQATSGAYAYLWNDSTTNSNLLVSASGVYSVSLTDSATGCIGSDSITVQINALPPANLLDSVMQCGTSTLLDAGVGAYAYNWSDSSSAQTLTVTNTGLYSVQVTDSLTGCVSNDTTYVMLNAIPVVSLGQDQNQCGGSVLLDAGAGYMYMWNDSSANQQLAVNTTGVYYVIITDSITGCAASDTTNITINALPMTSLGNDIVQCGGATTLSAVSGNYSYLWSTGDTTQFIVVSASGTFDVSVTDLSTGCVGSDTINVTINAAPTVTLTSTASFFCTTDANGGLTGSPSNGTYSGPGVSGNVFNPSVAGVGNHTITYTFIDLNG
ncbi:MAG: LamG domain-containing protein, partial [Bacteroidia bacterium]